MAYDRAALLTQLKVDEGVHLHPYADTKGLLTIGIGRNLDAVGISNAEAEMLCESDIARAEAALSANVPWWNTLSDNRQMALMNLCFNMGWGGLSTFKNMLAAFFAKEFDVAADDLLASKYATEVGARAQRVAALIRNG